MAKSRLRCGTDWFSKLPKTDKLLILIEEGIQKWHIGVQPFIDCEKLWNLMRDGHPPPDWGFNTIGADFYETLYGSYLSGE